MYIKKYLLHMEFVCYTNDICTKAQGFPKGIKFYGLKTRRIFLLLPRYRDDPTSMQIEHSICVVSKIQI